ncbi:MAG: class I tRNA ligase family protein [Gemmatimonadota bacterium]
MPWPDDQQHTVYVWIDALTNYLAAAGFPDDGYDRLWPADVHVIGKDITRFHCIYWPAMLMSAGIELPRTIWAHGFITYEGQRFSKSEGVSVELDEAVQRHGPDSLRYYLLHDVPWNGDGDFSWDRFDEIYTAELANDLGNLANRSLSMIERYRDGVVPAAVRTTLDQRVTDTLVRYRSAMDACLLNQGIAATRELTAAANGFVEEQAPWKQAKDPAQAAELDATLASLARALAALSTLLEPFLPDRMRSLAERLGLDAVPMLDDVATLDLAGHNVSRGEVLFPRMDR